jgi:predicted nucleic acid-binding protein
MDPGRAQTVVPYLSEHASEEFATSSLVVFELFRKATRRRRSQDVHAWLGQSLASIKPFTDQAAVTAAQAEAALANREPSLALRDLLIVAHAKALDATFVTADAADFQSQPIQQLFEIDIIQ